MRAEEEYKNSSCLYLQTSRDGMDVEIRKDWVVVEHEPV
jgi:hypothetical protein